MADSFIPDRVEIHVYHHHDERLDEALKVLKSLQKQGDKVMSLAEELTTAVADVSAKATANSEATARLSTQVDDVAARVLAALEAAGVDDPTLIAAIEGLKADSTTLADNAAAVDAQTTELEGIAAAPAPPAP